MVDGLKNGAGAITKDTRIALVLVIALVSAVYLYAERATTLSNDLRNVMKALDEQEEILLGNKSMIAALERQTVGRTHEGFHKQDVYNLCVTLERKNPGWKCADPYQEIPQRFPR